jgi:UDP-N-acetylglucosamine pyrophosphorylase
VYHIAKKAIPYAHPDTGKTLTKEEMVGKGNTGIKLERSVSVFLAYEQPFSRLCCSFIFDVFPASKHMAILEIKREEEFSPVKNAPGYVMQESYCTHSALTSVKTAARLKIRLILLALWFLRCIVDGC